MFRSLTETQIVSNLIDSYVSMGSNVDDMSAGSNLRSIFESFAQELKRLYQNQQESAYETSRMAAYSMFNFPLLPATAAYTVETFSTTTPPAADATVPVGTTVGVPGTTIQYKTQAPVTWTKNTSSVQILVVCTQTGSIGNRRANEVSQLVTAITGLSNVTVTNQRDIRTGSDLETDDQRASRFQEWINSLHKGDLRALKYGAKKAQILDEYGYIQEQVTKAQVVEGTGSNTIYIDNGYYSTSTQLVQACQQIIDGYVDSDGNFIVGYKAAGVPSTVQACSYQQVSITVNASARSGYTFNMIQQSIIDAITKLVQSLDVGQTLAVQDLNAAIGNTPGVLNFNHSVSADIAPAAGTLLKLAIGQPLVYSL